MSCACPIRAAYGSGNPGATNVLRSGRKSAAALTLFGDGLKGWAAVWLAKSFAPHFGLNIDVALWCGLAALIGHLFPVFFGFKGGKGVATALGVLLGFNLWVGLGCMATWMVMAALFRISSLAALTAAALSPVYAGMIMGWGKAAWVVLVMSALLFYRHKSNIRKLIAGEEGRIGREAPPPQPSPQAGPRCPAAVEGANARPKPTNGAIRKHHRPRP